MHLKFFVTIAVVDSALVEVSMERVADTYEPEE
jgi:hypothetical protein